MIISTRQRILDYLSLHRQATIPQISAALKMTRENIRYHLNGMLESGLIEAVTAVIDQPRGRGRPVRLFRPSAASRPNNLLELTGLLLDAFRAISPGGDEEVALRRLADALAGAEPFSKNLTQRLNQVVAYLNQKRYQARWEARPQGPLVIFRNCPYAALLTEHPELCRMDAYLLERLTGQPAEQTARINPFSGQPPACLFHLRPHPPKISAAD